MSPTNLHKKVIDLVSARGVVLVAAVGNDCLDLSGTVQTWDNNYPSEYNHEIAVAATDKDDSRAIWDSPDNPYICSRDASNWGSSVDISAPGTDVMSTNSPQTLDDLSCGNHLYCGSHGTSFAAPIVSGTAALLASRGFYACEIVETLTGHDSLGNVVPTDAADPVTPDPLSGTGGMGLGRLNAQKALDWFGELATNNIISPTNIPNGAIFHVDGSTQRYVINNGVKVPTSTYATHSDQCIPHGVFEDAAYVQGLFDCIPAALETWPIPAGDADCDGFPGFVAASGKAPETYIGTDPGKHCAATATANDEPTPDAMPPDFNDNKLISGQDTGLYGGPYGAFNHTVAQGPFGPPGNQLPGVRFDFNGDGIIAGQDTGKFQAYFNKSCA